jgi:hypothetical protein
MSKTDLVRAHHMLDAAHDRKNHCQRGKPHKESREGGMMSSHSEQGEEKSKGFSLDEELKSLDLEDLYNLVQNLIRKKPEVHRLVLEWFKEKAEASRVAEAVATLNDELLMEYWEKAENIISEFAMKQHI